MPYVPPPALPHGPLREVLPDTFFVSGVMAMPGPGIRFSRNMTVVRQGGELVLVNTVRLDEPGLAELDRLGKVAHVIRIAGFHGRDDAFYQQRYGARVHCVRGQQYSKGFGKPTPASVYFEADAQLAADSALPIEGARLHVFGATPPEAAIVWERHGGTLITGDSLQNWATADEHFSWAGKVVMRMLGFLRPHNVGPSWLKQAKPPAADLAALLELPFENVLPSHGTPVLGGASGLYRDAITRAIARAR